MTSDNLYICNACNQVQTRRKRAIRPPRCCDRPMTQLTKTAGDYGCRCRVVPVDFEDRYGSRALS